MNTGKALAFTRKNNFLMYALLYYITFPILWAIGWLPLPVLYIMSDISYFFVYKVANYRVKVVRTNMRNSFANKNEEELRRMEQKFYRHLCDYGFETIKYLHISKKEIKKRITFENIELIEELFRQGKSVIAIFGHYGNWEWISSFPLAIKNEYISGTVYRPLKNPFYDQFFIRLRSRFGTICISKKNILRAVLKEHKENRQFIFAFISDQTPSKSNLHYWTNFLNQDTPILIGWEVIARKTNDAVVYLDMMQQKRGVYRCRFELLSENPQDTKEFELVENYTRFIEKTILKEPAYWLWSHRRWKYSRNQA